MTAPSATVRAAFVALLLAGPAFAGLAGLPLSAAAAETTRSADGRNDGFVDGLGDVPAMPGLSPAESQPLIFDKPSGRIAQAVMTGRVDRKAVLAFYGQSMPQLGWKPVGDSRFVREGEELRLEFDDSAARAATGPATAGTTVRFTLSPR